MDLGELRKLVRRGEGEHLEFKRKANHPDKIAREVVAFANSKGGILLIGVDDDGSIYGSKYPGEDEFAIKDHLYKHCYPRLKYGFERIAVNVRREVLVFRIEESRKKPHALRDPESGKKTTYVRVEDMSTVASYEMVSYLRQSQRKKGVEIRFGDEERKLLQLLEDKPLTTIEDMKQALQLSRRKTSAVVLRMVRAGLIRIIPTANEDLFCLEEEAFRVDGG